MTKIPKFESIDDLIAAANKGSKAPFRAKREIRSGTEYRRRDEWAERAPTSSAMRTVRVTKPWKSQVSEYRRLKIAQESLVRLEGPVLPPPERTFSEWYDRLVTMTGSMRTSRDMGSPKLAYKSPKAENPEAAAKRAAEMQQQVEAFYRILHGRRWLHRGELRR